MHLTGDLIRHSSQYLNPLREFHLDLRGYKIAFIENLSSTNDQFATIDLTQNEITKIPLLPPLRRLRTILLSSNRLSKIDSNYSEDIPYLENMILTNNKIEDLDEIEHISQCKSLLRLSLRDNPISHLENYRLYTIYKIPSLRILDFQKVRMKERNKAKAMFGGKDAQTLKAQMQNKLDGEKMGRVNAKSMEEYHWKMQMIKERIANAKTLEEVSLLEQAFKSGKYDEVLQDIPTEMLGKAGDPLIMEEPIDA